jgi:hypothetical protein
MEDARWITHQAYPIPAAYSLWLHVHKMQQHISLLRTPDIPRPFLVRSFLPTVIVTWVPDHSISQGRGLARPSSTSSIQSKCLGRSPSVGCLFPCIGSSTRALGPCLCLHGKQSWIHIIALLPSSRPAFVSQLMSSCLAPHRKEFRICALNPVQNPSQALSNNKQVAPPEWPQRPEVGNLERHLQCLYDISRGASSFCASSLEDCGAEAAHPTRHSCCPLLCTADSLHCHGLQGPCTSSSPTVWLHCMQMTENERIQPRWLNTRASFPICTCIGST